MFKDLIGKSVSVITDHPDKWVSFMGPDADEKLGFGMFSPPWENSDGCYDSVFILWGDDGIIREVDSPYGHWKED